MLSSDDRKNLKWFNNDNTRQSLASISLERGKIRGLRPFKLDFSYPITAIAGANGSGKSTILALAACAFHNSKSGFRLPARKTSYYTFSDFFLQSKGEVGPEGVSVRYGIRHDKWRYHKPRLGFQTRRKAKGGKWNNYDSRVKRNVVYFGIQRVVPFFERSTHRSYRSRFSSGTMKPELRERIASLAGRILGKSYGDFEILEHTKYSLPRVQAHGVEYSGFNMGAGESAVLDILSNIFTAGEGCLVVIDEIELGLHERAQVQLIQVLKELCNELKCQIICTTHAYEVLASLPPEGRMFVDSSSGTTQILAGISPDYACGKMGRSDAHELTIFVEDEVGQSFVTECLDLELRSRCQIIEIGSHGSIKRLMAARFMEGKTNCIGILDGDQKGSFEGTKGEIANLCDGKFAEQKEEIKDWSGDHLSYLPGDEWPEKWIFETAISICEDPWPASPAVTWGVDSNANLKGMFERALMAGKHNEFFTLSAELSLPTDAVRWGLVSALKNSVPAEFDALADKVRDLLP